MILSCILTRLARRGLLAFCTLFALMALLGTQALPVSAATNPSFIRLINASPDVGTVDVFVDGSRFLGNARFASVTDYLQLPAGPHKVELALIGKGPSAGVLVQKLSVQAGAAYTVAAIGTKSTGFSLQVFVDDNRMVVGKATVRVYDLSPRSGTLSVVAGANVLFEPVSYRQASNYQRLAAGPYTFTFSSSQPAFTLVEQVTLKTDMVTSLFLVGMPNGTPPLQVVPMQVKGLPRLLAGTGSDPNALPVSTSELAPLIALPLGVLALAGIALAWFTRFWPFSRQKGSRPRLRPRKLYGAALGGILALLLSLGGLSFASFMTHPAAPAPTARLLIPAIGVNTPIESVGVQPNGAMDTARQRPWDDVGLYTGGPRPGDRGSAVIAGHLDRPGGNPAVFWPLRELQVGDEVQFVDAHGKITLFHVIRIEAYPTQDVPVQEIFGNPNGRFLNLTTCAGDWLPAERQRNMRLVIYTAFGPAPADTSSLTSWASLTQPSPSSHTATSHAAPLSPTHGVAASVALLSSSSSVSLTAMTSSTSSSVSPNTGTSSTSSSISSAPNPIPIQLPAALRPPVTVKLPGINQQVSQQLTSTVTRTSVVRRLLYQARRQLTSIPVVGTVLHQVSRQLTPPPVIGMVLHRANSQLTHTPVVGQLLHQVSSPLTHTTVVSNLLHQATSPLTRTPLVGKLLHQASSPLTNTPAVGQLLHRAGSPLTHTPVVGTVVHQVRQLTHTSVVGTLPHQVRQLTHTPLVGKPLHQISSQLTHTPVISKSLQQVKQLTHTPVVGKSLHQISSQLTHTPVVGKPLHRANSQLTHTPVLGQSLQQTSKQVTTHTPAVSKSLQQTSKQVTHTPAVGQSLHRANNQLTHTSGAVKLPHKAKK